MTVMITVPELAEQMGKSRNTLYEWALREEDPLPLRIEKDGRRNAVIDVEDFRKWWARNSVPYNERRK